MKVGIFLKTTGGSEKLQILKSFAKGVSSFGDYAIMVPERKYVSCDIALIFGFYSKNRSALQDFRKTIFETHTSFGKKCVFIDADPLKYAGEIKAERTSSPNMYFKIPYESIYYDKSKFFNKKCPPDRWNLICKKKKLNVLPYRKDGDHILICMNRGISKDSKSWATKGVDTIPWLFKIIKKIRRSSNRPIRVRFHPLSTKEVLSSGVHKQIIKLDKDISISGIKRGSTLEGDCEGAWAAVVYNTSASVIPIINGIPIFTEKKDCLTYDISNHNIEKFINKPKCFDREQWLNDLAYSLWCEKELRGGIYWKRLRSFVK